MRLSAKTASGLSERCQTSPFVIPESAKRLSGTHDHPANEDHQRALANASSSWVPVLPLRGKPG
jgi:hypothetical protein